MWSSCAKSLSCKARPEMGFFCLQQEGPRYWQIWAFYEVTAIKYGSQEGPSIIGSKGPKHPKGPEI